MAKKRTKQQKIKAQQKKIILQPSLNPNPAETRSVFSFKKSDLAATSSQPKLDVADLLMSKPAEIKSDLLKTVIVAIACLITLAAWYWRLRMVGG